MLQTKAIWQTNKLVKPYITNKGALSETDIMFIDQNELAEIFNDYFANIVKITTRKDPKNKRNDFPPEISNISLVLEIIKQYKKLPSVLYRKGNIKVDEISNISVVLVIIKQYKKHPSVLCIKGNVKVDEISNISVVLEIIKQYKKHPSVLCIKGNVKVDEISN